MQSIKSNSTKLLLINLNLRLINNNNYQTSAKLKHQIISSVDSDDVARHEKLANNWWDRYGPMKALHSLNQIRVPFIRDGILSTGVQLNKTKIKTSSSLCGLNLLEVGCGAGILTEQLARIHANMTSIDPSSELIDVAKTHLLNTTIKTTTDGIQNRIDYRTEPIELHCIENKEKYDAVIVSEVLEHIVDKAAFLGLCIDTLKPGGSIFITTFDKTCLSWFGSIVLAENIFRIVPPGTHNWNQYIAPIDTQRILTEYNCSTILVNGFLYEFWKDTWKWTNHTKFSYALHAVKGT